MRKLFTVTHDTNGKGPVQFAWNKGGNLLAICGLNRQLCLFDRQGKPVDQKSLNHPGACVALDWDCTGETLAVMQQGSATIVLWHTAGKKLEILETAMKELTFMKWNKAGPHLAVGTLKGNLLLYNKKTLKKMTVMGKHSKKITCGAWSKSGKLALGGDDNKLSINTSDGDEITHTGLKVDPLSVQFAKRKMKEGSKASDDTTLSVNLGGKTLLLYEEGSTSSEGRWELAFLPKYGSIVSHKWFGDGYILIGFSSGHVIVISTHVQEIGQEISYVVPHNESLSDVTYCPALQKGASIGDNCVQVFDMTEIANLKARDADKYELENEYGALQKVEWTDDGQILSVSSRNGNVHCFLTKIPVMFDAHDTRVLFLTSLRELCVQDLATQQDVAHITVEIEPTFLTLGPEHAAVGMNNCVWYYSLQVGSDSGPPPMSGGGKKAKAAKIAKVISQRSYVSSVEFVKLSSEHAAVMSDGKVTLHLIAEDQAHDAQGGYGYDVDERKTQRVFPEKEGGENRVTCVEMSQKFMCYGTAQGSIVYFSLEDWTIISEYRNIGVMVGIRSLFPNHSGTRLAFIDDTNDGYIYSPVDDTVCKIDQFSMDTDKILWDTTDWGIFAACEAKQFTIYTYAPHTRWGAQCAPVTKSANGKTDRNTTPKPALFNPVLMRAGGVVCQMSSSGTMAVVNLATHSFLSLSIVATGEHARTAFFNSLGLNMLDQAWSYAKTLNDPDCWYALGDKALNLLDINMAIRVYRMVQQPAMVLALDPLQHLNEKSLLLGHVSMLFKNFNDAQTHFMRSSNPALALEMRRDLMHWNAALELSERLSPESIPQISREYASQLEFRGEYQQALDMYNKGIVQVSTSDSTKKQKEDTAHNDQCHAGVARITIRMGDITGGFQIAMETDSKTMSLECAHIFEELRQWTEAAQLFEKAADYEKAARIYICQTKNLKAAATLMPNIHSHKIQALFGAAKEKEGSFEDAKQAYINAQDWDNVVRLLVEHLGDLSSAYDIVRRTKSAEAAALVAKHCKKDGNPETAIEFLLLAKKTAEAFELASSHDHMHTVCFVVFSSFTSCFPTSTPQHSTPLCLVPTARTRTTCIWRSTTRRNRSTLWYVFQCRHTTHTFFTLFLHHRRATASASASATTRRCSVTWTPSRRSRTAYRRRSTRQRRRRRSTTTSTRRLPWSARHRARSSTRR